MDIRIDLYENIGTSPAWQYVPEATDALLRAGLSSPRFTMPPQDEACLVACLPFKEGEPYTFLGFMAYRFIPSESSWWISLTYVVPEYRRKGVHTALFKTLEARALKRGDILSLQSGTHPNNTAAQRAFARQGRDLYYIAYKYDLKPFVAGKNPLEVKDEQR